MGSASLIDPLTPPRSSDELLQLLYRPMDEHLGRTIGAIERPRDLAIVHAQGEAHDQRLATVVRELAHPVQHAAELVAALDQLLGRMRSGQRCRLFDRRGRLAGAVPVEVGGEVVGDTDEPRTKRAPVRLPLRALEVPIGLKECLLGQVLRIVMVSHAVVGVAVHVAQMGAIEL